MEITQSSRNSVCKIVVYRDCYTQKIESSPGAAAYNAQLHICTQEANDILKAGGNLYEALSIFDYSPPPEAFKNITLDFKFRIPHWQCCEQVGYQLKYIEGYDTFYVRGDAGSAHGEYGSTVKANDLLRYYEDTVRYLKG